jgi:Argininosuccinate lyase
VRLADLSIDDFLAQWPECDETVYEHLGVERAVRAFRSYGSASPEQVRKQIDEWKRRITEPNRTPDTGAPVNARR